MAYGFQFFDALGDKFLDTNSFAWSILDAFVIDRLQATSGSKTYTDLPAGTTLIATYDAFFLAGEWSGAGGFGTVVVSASGNTVSWLWELQNQNLAGPYIVSDDYPFDKATVTVLVK